MAKRESYPEFSNSEKEILLNAGINYLNKRYPISKFLNNAGVGNNAIGCHLYLKMCEIVEMLKDIRGEKSE